MRSVQILGTAPNLHETPPLLDGEERWACNSPQVYYRRWRGPKHTEDTQPGVTFTRWWNLHSKRHMLRKYPDWYRWYGEQVAPKRIILQEAQSDIPCSERFDREAVMAYAGHTFFTFSGAWQMATVGYERAAGITPFDRVVLAGFQLNEENHVKYRLERPCFFYWVNRLQDEGIEVVLPKDLTISAPGDPFAYDGPLYGYETT